MNNTKTVPKEWKKIKIRDCIKLQGGFAFKSSEFADSGLPILRISNIKVNGIDLSEAAYYPEEKAVNLDNFLLHENNIVIAMSGATTGKIGVIKKENLPLFINQRVGRFLVKDEKKISNNYLKQIVVSSYFQGEVNNMAIGGAQPNISGSQIESIEIMLPPLNEQNKIAEILSSVDDEIEKVDQEIKKTELLKKGLMHELFTKGIGHKKFKKTKLGFMPEEWQIVYLENILSPKKYSLVDGPFGSNLKTIHYKSEGIPVFQSGFVTRGEFFPTEYLYVDEEKFNEQKRSAAYPGDILMAKIGMNAGACALIPDDHPVGILAGNSLKITLDPEKCNKSYLLYVLWSYKENRYLERLHSTTAQPAISLSALKKLEIKLPPLVEQEKIAEIFNSINKKISINKKNKFKLIELKNGLMQDLLSGEVRVNN